MSVVVNWMVVVNVRVVPKLSVISTGVVVLIVLVVVVVAKQLLVVVLVVVIVLVRVIVQSAKTFEIKTNSPTSRIFIFSGKHRSDGL